MRTDQSFLPVRWRGFPFALALALSIAGCAGSPDADPSSIDSALSGELGRSGWTITASPSAGHEAYMIDGDPSTRWTTGVAMANGDAVILDLGAAQTFNRIDLDAGSSSGDYPRGYAIYVSSDGASWGSAIATGSGASQLVSVSFASQSSRYVKIVQTGSAGNWWSIHELHLYTSTAPLSRTGWVASASSTPSDPCCSGDVAARALDGNASTRWSTGIGERAGQWFQVDMGQVNTISSLTMDAGTSTGDYPRGYQVLLSTDGTTFNQVASGTGASQLVTVSFSAQSARYIKIVQTGTAGNWWSIHELNVYGSASSPPPPPPPSSGHVKLASCNTQNQSSPSGDASVLGPLDADVVFLQEIENAAAVRDAMNAYETNTAHSGKVWTISSSYDTAVMTWHPVSGGYEVHDIGYSSWPGNAPDQWPSNPHRYGVRATISVGGTPVTFLGTHLDWNPNSDMTNHVSNRNNFLSWASSFSGRVIAGGDLNAWTWGGNTTEGNEQRNTISAFSSRWTDYCVQLDGETWCNNHPTISSGWTPDHLYHSGGLTNVSYSTVYNPYSDHKIVVVEADLQ